MICGDFNARLGELPDCIMGVDEIPERNIIDSKRNSFGTTLSSFCCDAEFCTLHGRNTDKDNFTDFTENGSSVVDYCLVPYDKLNLLKEFSVCPPHDLVDEMERKGWLEVASIPKPPQHAILHWQLDLSSLIPQQDTFAKTPSPDTTTFQNYQRYKSADIPKETWKTEETKSLIQSLITKLENQEEHQTVVNEVMTEFNESILSMLTDHG
eukprot:Lithocolla_globosa_v1_NODE_518_length_3838_cov_6.179752.p2 type:complete len:210 gc:universal NODE_518_length_3838_cov_6.179752:3159-2530(-)